MIKKLNKFEEENTKLKLLLEKIHKAIDVVIFNGGGAFHRHVATLQRDINKALGKYK